MKAFLGIFVAILLLSAVAPAKANPAQVNINGINRLGTSLLGIDLQLVADVDLNILGLLAVDVNVVLVTNDGQTFVGTTMASFQGLAGETTTVFIDVGDASFLTANVVVSLGNLRLLVDNLIDGLIEDVDCILGDNLVGELVEGVLVLVEQVLDAVFDLLNGLLGYSVPRATVGVIGVQPIGNNQALVALQLQQAVPGGLTLDLNVDLLNILGIVAHIDTQTVVFSGVPGQVVNVVVDLSVANGLIDGSVFLQLSIGNINLNLNLNLQVVLDLSGLNNLLDNLLHILKGWKMGPFH